MCIHLLIHCNVLPPLFLLFTKRVYFNGKREGVGTSTQKLPPFSLSLSTWDQSSFIINHFHFIFITNVTYTHTIFTAFCVCLEQHKTTFWVTVAIYVWWKKENQLSHSTTLLLYLYVRQLWIFTWWRFITMHGKLMWGFYYANILSLLLSRRVCMSIFAIFTVAFV